MEVLPGDPGKVFILTPSNKLLENPDRGGSDGAEMQRERNFPPPSEAPQGGRSRGFLDIPAKYATPQAPKADFETGEIWPVFDPTLKWQLKRIAVRAIGIRSFRHNRKNRRHRVCKCMKWRKGQRCTYDTTHGAGVYIHQSRESGKTYFSGLQTCGSVWVCPVCAPKIQHIRAQEVRAAIDYWTEQGGSVVMPTHTAHHTKADKLSPLLEAFTKALRASKTGKGYKLRKDRYGIQHSIRALEVTHGSNGWHPHAHTIMFLDRTVCLDELAGDLFPLWESATRRAGLREPSRQAFKVVDASKVRSYVTKLGTEYQWNAEHELVKAHSKSGNGASFSPFDMLRSCLDNYSVAQGRRFREFALAFFGRRQLVWSNGSKKALGIKSERTDQQIADSIGELDLILGEVTGEQWAIVRRNNLQGDVLQVAEHFGRQGVKHLLSQFK